MADKSLPPLITPRSPSYERARRELAHPSPPGDDAVIAAVGRLVEAEHDAARASRAAGASGAAADHEARAAALGQIISDLGGSPPRSDESRDLLTHGEREVQGSADPTSVLRAMRDELAAMYADAARDPQLSDAQRAAIQKLAPA